MCVCVCCMLLRPLSDPVEFYYWGGGGVEGRGGRSALGNTQRGGGSHYFLGSLTNFVIKYNFCRTMKHSCIHIDGFTPLFWGCWGCGGSPLNISRFFPLSKIFLEGGGGWGDRGEGEGGGREVGGGGREVGEGAARLRWHSNGGVTLFIR